MSASIRDSGLQRRNDIILSIANDYHRRYSPEVDAASCTYLYCPRGRIAPRAVKLLAGHKCRAAHVFCFRQQLETLDGSELVAFISALVHEAGRVTDYFVLKSYPIHHYVLRRGVSYPAGVAHAKDIKGRRGREDTVRTFGTGVLNGLTNLQVTAQHFALGHTL